MKKVRVEDLADCPCNKSDQRETARKDHPLLIPLMHHDRLQVIIEQGFQITYDPPGDASCQFSAFVLARFGIFKSAETLRQEVVKYLREHDRLSDGYLIELFIGMPWGQYVNEIDRDEIYGDEIT